jgi:hypothetical protein
MPRATMSVVPAGGYGTTKRIGLVGYALVGSAAPALADRNTAALVHAITYALFFLFIRNTLLFTLHRSASGAIMEPFGHDNGFGLLLARDKWRA